MIDQQFLCSNSQSESDVRKRQILPYKDGSALKEFKYF